MPHKGARHVVQAFRLSLKGLKAAMRYEEAFRLELIAFAFMAPLAVWLGEAGTRTIWLLSSLFLVLIVELLNSAIETVVDRIGIEHHELSGRAKDLGSAAVFFALLNALATWGWVAYLRFWG